MRKYRNAHARPAMGLGPDYMPNRAMRRGDKPAAVQAVLKVAIGRAVAFLLVGNEKAVEGR